MQNKTMFKIFIFIIGVAKVLALKCHVCDNFDTALCLKIEKAQDRFLHECAQNETRCALLVEKTIDLTIIRKCVKPSWNCDLSKYNCKTCETDGCNTGTDIEKPLKVAVNKDLIMSNIYGIGVIVLLITVLLIWCGIRMCSKKKEIEYEEEDDCDEYYENETNIDLEEPTSRKC